MPQELEVLSKALIMIMTVTVHVEICPDIRGPQEEPHMGGPLEEPHMTGPQEEPEGSPQ